MDEIRGPKIPKLVPFAESMDSVKTGAHLLKPLFGGSIGGLSS